MKKILILIFFVCLLVTLIPKQNVYAYTDNAEAISDAKTHFSSSGYSNMMIIANTNYYYAILSNDTIHAGVYSGSLYFGAGTISNSNSAVYARYIISKAGNWDSPTTADNPSITNNSGGNSSIIYSSKDIYGLNIPSPTTITSNNNIYHVQDEPRPPVINIITPTGNLHGGLNIQIPYSFNVSNLNYSGMMHYGIKPDSVLAVEDIIGKDETYNSSIPSISNKFTLDIGTGNYKFYVEIKYNDGIQEQTLYKESTFAIGADLNTVNGQDVVTGNSTYNNMLKFTNPVYGQLYDYGQPESYTITADKSYYDPATGMPLEQYLPPMPEETGNWQQDQIAKEARGMVYIVQNGQLNQTLRISLQEFYQNDVTKNFPWYKNNGIASMGENDIILVSCLHSPVKTEFYNYYLQGGNYTDDTGTTYSTAMEGYYHIYAGSKFIVGDDDIGIVNPSIPVVGGSQLPLRGDYPDGVLGAVEYGFATLMSYLTFPIKLIVGGLTYIITILGELVSQATGLSYMMTTFFSFLPIEVRNLMSLSIVAALVYTAYKMIRGQ